MEVEGILCENSVNNSTDNHNKLCTIVPELPSGKTNISPEDSSVQTPVGVTQMVEFSNLCVNPESPTIECKLDVDKEIISGHISINALAFESSGTEKLKVDSCIRECVNAMLQELVEYTAAVVSASQMGVKADPVVQTSTENISVQDDYSEDIKWEPKPQTERLEMEEFDVNIVKFGPRGCPPDCVIHDYEFEGDIQLVTGSWTEFANSSDDCFTKGCKWAPDGTCILTNSDDNILRIFDVPPELHCQNSWMLGRTLPEMEPALRIQTGEQIYDYCWYPQMDSYDPFSCCLASACQNCPINLWDAYMGSVRCTYRPYNEVDEVEHPFSLAFNPSGEKLYCGFKSKVRVFDTSRPGRDCVTRSLKGWGRVVNMVSTICVNPSVEKLYAVGSYSKNIALCSEPEGKVLCLFCGHRGGLTHLNFTPDGNKLYAGCRKDSQILCWDIRNLGTVLYSLEREVNNNQRIYFDISTDGRYVMSGGTNGKVQVWDTLIPPVSTGTNYPVLPVFNKFQASDDCLNGISLHRQYPILATTSGQRHFGELDEESDGGADAPLFKKRCLPRENGLKLWWLGKISTEPTPQISYLY